MTVTEEDARPGGTYQWDHRQPGSKTSRLAEASQQLEIVFEEVDLEEEPEFGEALVEAIDAVDEAATHARRLSDSDSAGFRNEERFEWGCRGTAE